MFGNSINMALIPYTPPLTPIEFVKSEVERGLSNGSISINETIPHPEPFWKSRPSEINDSISRAFRSIAHDAQSQWGVFNGSETYGIAEIKEHKLMKKLILKAPAECKDFYALDIGAGNYQWGRGLAKYLNTKKKIPKDVTIHIIGIRGENNLDKEVTTLGQCKLYEFGQFQVETLTDEFQKRGLQLTNKVDLAVSRWSFRHLVDPVGTFAQTYDLLRPKTGHLMIDGFFFLHENEKMDDESLDFNGRMTQLCLETRAPFLTRYYSGMYSLDHFIVNKPNTEPCAVQKQYLGTEYAKRTQQIGSYKVTRFKKADVETPLLYKKDEYKYRGDKGLYERLRQNGLFDYSDLVWGPLQEKDANKKKPPLHIAIAEGNEEAIDRCLQDECDINESDDTGATPLHLAITHNNYKLFSLLLEKGALTKLVQAGCTPLHLATRYDLDGRYIKALILAGADVNIKPNGFDRLRLTPLDFAIQHKNVKAVELLLEAKAIVNYKNRKLLNSDSTFSSIRQLLPKQLNELEGFDTIIDHIQKGDCVILSYPNDDDEFRSKKFQKSTLGETGKLIRVFVNPETRLLDDSNCDEIKDLSGCQESYPSAIDMCKEPHLELRLGY